MAGGAVFSNLDYSFTPEHEDGTAKVEDPTPGGGGRVLRTQLGILKTFVEGFDLVHVRPDTEFLKASNPAEIRGKVHGLADRRAGDYAVYVPEGPRTSRLRVDLPSGRYHARWIDPRDGKTLKDEEIDASGNISSPEFAEDVVRSNRQVERDSEVKAGATITRSRAPRAGSVSDVQELLRAPDWR